MTALLACQKQNLKPEIRLQKYLALCGVGSRRACERLIAERRVTVDGKTVDRQGVRINPQIQAVMVDGRQVVPEPKIYILFNKPCGVICTAADPAGRKTIYSLLPPLPARVFTVGRLDCASEGLLIITSDGEFAQLVSHPRNMVEKVYLAAVARALTWAEQKRFKEGIYSEDELLRVNSLRLVEEKPERFVYEIKISEGRNRHIRRMFTGLSLEVLALKRIAIGPLKPGDIRVGQWRHMNAQELENLKRYIVKKAKNNLLKLIR